MQKYRPNTNQPFPPDVNMFNEVTKLIVSMLSQFLGLDIDIYVLESVMSLLFRFSMSESESQYLPPPCLKFDEFLPESIHS